MSNIIDSIQLSGVTYQIQGSGGGKAIEAGRGITITTGETADTVSFNLPISAGTGTASIVEGGINNRADVPYSHAEGYNTQANGQSSHAEGQGTKANGSSSHAEGRNTEANGHSSHAEGYRTTASGQYSHAEGNSTSAMTDYSHAEGNSTLASGIYSHAEGLGTSASSQSSHAEGEGTSASGESSHTEGKWTKANGLSSHAEGQGTSANGMMSHAEGSNTTANNKSEHASGQYNVSSSASTEFGDSGNTLFSVGNGTADNARHNAFEIRQNGDIYLSSGGTDIKLQDHLGGGGSVTVDAELDSGSTNPVENRVIYNKIDEVEEVTAAGLNALNSKITPTVELTQAQYDALVTAGTVSADTYYIITDAQAGDLTNYYTKSETNTLLGGKQDTLVSSSNIKTINNESILGSGNIDIQGGSTYTAGRGISIANDTISFSLPISAGTGSNSIIEGNTSNKASGTNSHAEGYNTTASGSYSHAEGKGTVASGSWGSHAEGASTTASGQYSHAEGSDTKANGYYSHAEGKGTTASGQSEHASGQYNVSNKANNTWGDSGNTLFSVGNGTADNARHNAFEIRQNGDIYLTKDGQDVKLQDQLGGSSITVDTALDSGSTNPVQNKALYDELRIIEPTETILQWAQSDGGESTNYPSGCTKVVITIDEQQMTYGAYTLYDNNYDCFGVFVIESNGGDITVSTTGCESEPTTSITYSISGNVVTVEYPTITNVTKIGTSYDNYWTWKAIVNNATPLIDKVIENEEVTAAALNALNDNFGGLKLVKLSQAEYNALATKDASTLYIIVN